MLNINYNDLTTTFKSKLKADEILYLLYGLKTVVRQGFYNSEKDNIQKFCQKNDLFISWSDFKIIIQDKDFNFSNKGLKVPLNNQEQGMQFCYISKNERLALLAQLFEKQNKHARLGELLGYPICCIAYFQNSFNDQNTNPEITQIKTGILSLSQRNVDVCLLSHFPCSSDCFESKVIAKERLELLEQIAADREIEVKKILKI